MILYYEIEIFESLILPFFDEIVLIKDSGFLLVCCFLAKDLFFMTQAAW